MTCKHDNFDTKDVLWNHQKQTTTIKLMCGCGVKATIKVNHQTNYIAFYGDTILCGSWAKGLKKLDKHEIGRASCRERV